MHCRPVQGKYEVTVETKDADGNDLTCVVVDFSLVPGRGSDSSHLGGKLMNVFHSIKQSARKLLPRS